MFAKLFVSALVVLVVVGVFLLRPKILLGLRHFSAFVFGGVSGASFAWLMVGVFLIGPVVHIALMMVNSTQFRTVPISD